MRDFIESLKANNIPIVLWPLLAVVCVVVAVACYIDDFMCGGI